MTPRRAGWLALVGLALAAPSTALAIPAPMTRDRLDTMAPNVIEGAIRSTRLTRVVPGSWTSTQYLSEIKVTKVLKGNLKVGATIKLAWQLESWSGPKNQPQPVGRTPTPYFGVCDHLRLYLGSGNDGVYGLVYYNAWSRLSGSVGGAPSRPGDTLKCKKP